MARKLQSTKNQEAKNKFNAKSAESIRDTIARVNGEVLKGRESAAKVRSGERSNGNDVYVGQRDNPTAIVSPKASNYQKNDDGSKTYVGPKYSDLTLSQGLQIAAGPDAAVTPAAAGPAGSTAFNQAAKDAGKQAINAQLAQAEKDTQGAALAHGGVQIAQFLNNGPLGDLLQDLGQDTGKEGASQNVAQAILNAASTGLYAVAGGARGQQEAHNAHEASVAKKYEEGDILGGIGESVQGTAEAIGGSFAGAGQGVAEGLGFRFGRKPTTFGQVLEEAGTEKALKGALGDEAGGTVQGVVGTAADILGDPTTYLTLGVAGGVKGAAKAAAAASKGVAAAAADAGKVASTASRLGAGAGAAPKGFLEGMLQRQGEAIGRRATARSNAAARAAAARPAAEAAETEAELATTAARATPEVTDDLAAAQLRTDADAAQVTALGETTEAAARTAEPAALPDPRRASVQQVLDNASVAVKAAVPAKTILQSARAVATTKLPREIVTGIRDLTVQPTAVSRRGLDELRATPLGAEVLARQVTFPNGMTGTVEKLIQLTRSAVNRDADNAGELAAHLDTVLEGPEGAGMFDPQRFAQALRDTGTRFRGVTGDDMPTDQLEGLLGKLEAAPSDRARLTLLGKALSTTTQRQPGDVLDFIDQAVAGTVDETSMRAMIRALGIQTRARSTSKLQEILGSTGRVKWQEMQDAVGTPEHALAEHGVAPEVIDDAAKLDLTEEASDAATEANALNELVQRFDADDARYVELDPSRVGRPDSSLGQAVEDGARELGRIAATRGRAGDPSNYMDSSAKGFFVSTHRSLMQKLGFFALRSEGAGRVNSIAERYFTGLRALEAEARSLGFTPVIHATGAAVNAPRARPMFVSLGEFADAIGNDVYSDIMFSPMLGRSSFAKEEKAGEWRLSLFPNHLLNAGRFSRTARVQNLTTPAERADAIATFLTRESTRRLPSGPAINRYATTPEGKADIAKVAERLADERVQEKLSFYHGKNEVRMAAIANQAAGEILQPIVARLQSALGAGAIRSEIAALIRDVSRDVLEATKNTYGEGDTLIRDLTKQRLDQGVLEGILGAEGMSLVHADNLLAHAGRSVGYETMQQGASRAGRDLEFQGNVAVAVDKVDRDLADIIDERSVSDLDDAIAANPNGLDENEAVAFLSTRASRRIQMTRPGALWEKFAAATYGSYGMGPALRTAAAVKDEAQGTATRFANELGGWLRGRQGRPGLGARLGQARGTDPVPPEAMRDTLKDWWSQLAQVPRGLSMDEIRAILIRGAARTTDTEEIRAVSAGEANLMIEFRRAIDAVFNEDGTGLFATAGATAAHVRREQEMFGFHGAYEGFRVNPNQALSDQADLWRSFEFADQVDPLTLLANYGGAMSTASMIPRVSQMAARYLDHTAAGLSDDAAKQLGWKTVRVDPQRPDSIAAMLPPGSRFDEAGIRNLSYLDDFLRSSRQFSNAKVQAVAGTYNRINYFIKALGTVWRLGHHVTSVLGELGALLMDNVSPTQALRGWRITAQDVATRNPEITSALEHLKPLTPDAAGGPVTGRGGQLGDTVQVVTRGGKVREYSPAEIVNLGRQYGVYITHETIQEVDDVARSALKSTVRRAIGAPNRVVSKISAVRDNGTRLAHFIAVLEREQHESLEAAFLSAATRTNEFHPTWNGLSRFESKIASRVFFYYTWVKQMAGLVIRETLDRPGAVTMPAKLQYNIAEASGLDPESIGQPFNEEEQVALPTYITRGITAPTLGSLESGQALWGFNPGLPQLDSLQTAFGGFEPSYGEPGYTQGVNTVRNGVGEAILGNLNPLIKAPYELGSLTHIEDSTRPVGSPTMLTDDQRRWQWLFDNTGGSITGGLKGTGAYGELFPKTTYGMDPESPEYKALQQQERTRAWLNWTLGARITNYNSPGIRKSAEFENKDIAKKLLPNDGRE